MRCRAKHARGSKLSKLDDAGAGGAREGQPLDDACHATERIGILLGAPEDEAELVVAFDDVLLKHVLQECHRTGEQGTVGPVL